MSFSASRLKKIIDKYTRMYVFFCVMSTMLLVENCRSDEKVYADEQCGEGSKDPG